jgi:hypothetical protein
MFAVRRTGSLVAALLAALTFTVFVVAAAPAQAALLHTQIQNKERGFLAGPACLEIDNARYWNNAYASVDWCDQYGLQMEWKMLPLNDGSGFVQLQVAHSGQCLEVNGGQYSDGAQVVQYPCLPGRSQQQWKFVYKSWANGMNFYEIVARHSLKCLDKSGWNVIQWNCHGADWQQWSLPS